MNTKLSNQFDKQIEYLSRSRGIRDTFTDLLDLLIFPLTITDPAGLARNPLPGYPEAERAALIELTRTFGELADNDGTGLYDALGDLFMEHLSFGRNGQFFTPQPICDMMAMMQGKPEPGQTVCDPSCGSGRTLLAMAKIERDLRFYGSDIDLTCVKMATVNLAYNNLAGEIAWMNTISMDHWGSFRIDREPVTSLPYITTLPAGQTSFIQRLEASTIGTPATPAPEPLTATGSAPNDLAGKVLQQGSLF